MSAEAVLQERGIVLPEMPSPVGNYVPAVVHNGVVDKGVELIGKPFTVDELAARVREVLDGN